MMRPLLALLAVLLALAPAPARAWWEYGHQTVARIAWIEASPHTRAAIRRLLAHSTELGTPECPARTLAEASVWPDCVKPLKDANGQYRFGYAYNWHFQDADICKPFDLTAPCAGGDCVSAQITRQSRLLADKRLSSRERLMALAFLVHFVGDLHQPLHAGEHDDQGANKVAAIYGQGGKRTNLHAIWDGYLAERSISTPPADARGLLSGVTARERHRIASGDIADWSRESWRVSHDSAYAAAFGHDPCDGAPGTVVLDEAKIETLIPVARRQILRGGLRLARLLDAAL